MWQDEQDKCKLKHSLHPAHRHSLRHRLEEVCHMAGKKAATLLVKLLSTAGTGYFYVARKNPRKLPQKLEFVK